MHTAAENTIKIVFHRAHVLLRGKNNKEINSIVSQVMIDYMGGKNMHGEKE